MSDQKKVSLLRQSPIFHNLTDEELTVLAERCRERGFSRSDTLIRENLETSEIYVIVSGRVEIRLTVPSLNGKEKEEVIATLKPGEMVGELTLLGRSRRSASATAKDEVQVLEWSRSDLLKLFTDHARIGYVVMFELAKLVADRLHATNMSLRRALGMSAL